MIFVKIMFLPMMLKLLDRVQRPFWLALIYALGLLTNGLIFDGALGGHWLQTVLVPFGQALIEAWAFFWLLLQVDGTGAYWAVLITGVFALLWF